MLFSSLCFAYLLSLFGEQTKECETLQLRSADYASQLRDLNATVCFVTFFPFQCTAHHFCVDIG